MVSVNNSLFSQIGIRCFYSVVSVQAKLISSEPSSEMLFHLDRPIHITLLYSKCTNSCKMEETCS